VLLKAVGRAKPLMHCFGHILEGYGAKVVTWGKKEDRMEIAVVGSKIADGLVNMYPDSIKQSIRFGEETLMVNATIRDGKGHLNRYAEIRRDLPGTEE
jgi:hypothetical protein